MKIRHAKDFPDAEWLENPTHFIWLREAKTMAASHLYKVKMGKNARVIGRNKMEKKGFRHYEGIFWWIANDDFEAYKNTGSNPIEAVVFKV